MVDEAELWLRRFCPVPQPSLRLLCLPHAGGSAVFYRHWARQLAPEFEVIAAQYPGRLDRVGEPSIEDMDQLADTLAALVTRAIPQPLALFGHSMGAAVAYELAARLEQRWSSPAQALFVSGRPAPRHHQGGSLHMSSDEQLWRHVMSLGGIPDEICELTVVRAAALGPLRSDYRLMERYRPRQRPPLRLPVSAIIGADDPEVTEEQARAWSVVSDGPFDLRVLPGGHFYLVGQHEAVLAAVRDRLRSLPATGAPVGGRSW